MPTETISWKRYDVDEETGEKIEISGTITYNVPDSISEAVERFGEGPALDFLNRALTIALQNIARRANTSEEAQKLVDEFVPGVSRSRSGGGPSKKALVESFKNLSPEDQAALFARIQEMSTESA